MKIGPILSFIIFLIVFPSFSFSKDIAYTQDDRERLIRVETKVEEGLKAVNQRIDGLEKSVNQRIDDLRSEFRNEITSLRQLVYVVIAGIFVLIGFVIWDRRSALAPAIRKSKELEEKQELLEKAIKEYSKKQPELAEILKSLGIL